MARSRRLAYAFAPVATLTALSCMTSRAHAHSAGLSKAEYTVRGDVVTAELTFARADVAEIAPSEIARAIDVRGDGQKCPGALEAATTSEQDGVDVHARYVCPTSPSHVTIDMTLFERLPSGHVQIARGAFALGPPVDALLSRDHARLTLDAISSLPPPLAPTHRARFADFFAMGIAHILTGIDHLLFLFALVLVGGRLRSIALSVTAFTVAHSITLAMATLDVWVLSARVIEPAIALSVAYVGLENFFVRDGAKRWRITFPFGLVHGFGFASALREIAIARAELPAALVGFNLGVEAGQLGVLAVLLPIVLWLRKRRWFAGARPIDGVRLSSAMVVVIGAAWFAVRVSATMKR
jgi:hydrogenase/urease accessory protein HupE